MTPFLTQNDVMNCHRIQIQVTGILDFGDTSFTWRVAEPAIMLCYVILMASNPQEAAMQTLVSYTLSCLTFCRKTEVREAHNCMCRIFVYP